MNANGADLVAHLAARVAELEAAQRILVRALETMWRARLVELERDVDVILEALITGGDVAALIAQYNREIRSGRTRAPGGQDHGTTDGD